MKHQKDSEVFVATPENVTALEVATEVLGQCEMAVYDDFKTLKTLFTNHDTDLGELMFGMAEMYSRKQITGPSRAFKVKVSVVVEELKGK